MDIIGFMDRVIVHSTCVVALIALLGMALAFTRWNYLENRVPVVVSFISLLLCCVGVAYLLRGHSITDAVFGVACFIWIAVCVATSYAFGEWWRQLYAFSCNENTKNLPALIGAGVVVILGGVAWVCLLQWILT